MLPSSNSRFVKTLRSVSIAALTILPISMAHSTEIQGLASRGKEKTQMCAGCHSIEGWKTAFPRTYRVPKIAGQHTPYLIKALQAYKSGERSHPTMRAIASSLSEQDIVDLATYYSAQRP